MPLSLNEIRKRAIEFSKEWEHASDERAESQSFWNAFFNVFGVSRKRVANFEKPIKKFGGHQGYIDLLWKGIVLVEHKSGGKDLDTAYKQAKDYFPGLKDEELPRYIIVSNFQQIKLYDLLGGTESEFKLKDLYKNINLFGFISGYEQRVYKDQEPVNIEAAELMGGLHDALLANGYQGHELEVMLVRLLFCLFAEDTTIFDKQQFTEYIELRTKEDGSDLGIHLAQLSEVLNTPEDKRLKNLDEQLAAFPYVNGSLYSEHLHFASFDSDMRNRLLKCCYFDWSVISPAIFGSMFQSVMNPKERRNLGAHYTSEKNILKLIKGLFLDELYEEFESVRTIKTKLQKFHDKISKLTFLDPACGCGNFLIITYRELRALELEVLKILFKGQLVTDVSSLSKIDVDAFYGIEYEEFPAQIATVAMWLSDHQMNLKLSTEFGEYFKRLPLKKSATVVNGNALRLKWEEIIPKERLSYILGNPPFIGTSYQSKEQKEDMAFVFNGVKSSGMLDYVCAWYILAAKLIQNSSIQVAFVSTNSITQGEQVAGLWSELFKYGLKINFAHRTFKWVNEAKGKAAVHVVIVGFSCSNKSIKYLFEYDNQNTEPLAKKVKNISPYLIEGDDVFVSRRKTQISNVPELIKGNQPTDNGYYLFTDEEKEDFIKKEPKSKVYFKKFIGSHEFINGINRWCLWLKDITPTELKHIPLILERVEKVKQYRLKSTKAATRKKAETAYLFDEIRHTNQDYLVIPEVSSSNRKYIPLGYVSKDVITSNKNYMLPNATLFHFGILNSIMHMIWIVYVSGRLKSDYQYSTGIVYNNFPWPENLPVQKIQGVEKLAQQVLKVRERYPESSLADLYNPLTMPADLVRAHQDLDRFVDACYRPQSFETEMQRIEFLFDLYKKYTQPLFGSVKKKKGTK